MHNHTSKAALFAGKQSEPRSLMLRSFVRRSKFQAKARTTKKGTALSLTRFRTAQSRTVRPKSTALSPPLLSFSLSSVPSTEKRTAKAQFGSAVLCSVRQLLLDASKELKRRSRWNKRKRKGDVKREIESFEPAEKRRRLHRLTFRDRLPPFSWVNVC